VMATVKKDMMAISVWISWPGLQCTHASHLFRQSMFISVYCWCCYNRLLWFPLDRKIHHAFPINGSCIPTAIP